MFVRTVKLIFKIVILLNAKVPMIIAMAAIILAILIVITFCKETFMSDIHISLLKKKSYDEKVFVKTELVSF